MTQPRTPTRVSNTLCRTYVFTGPIIALSSVGPTRRHLAHPRDGDDLREHHRLRRGDIVPTNATVANFSGFGSSYAFDLVPSAQGLVTASVPAGVFHDGATNPNTASNLFNRVFDSGSPSIVLTSGAPDPTNGVITVNAALSESASDFTIGDVVTTNATVTNFTGSGTSYSFDLIPSSPGLVSANVPAGAFHDGTGNPNTASNTISRTYVNAGPVISLSSLSPDPTSIVADLCDGDHLSATTDFDAGDITPGNASVANFAGSGASYSFDLVPSGQGLVTAIVAAGAFHDGATNPNVASNLFSRTFDSAGPTVTLSSVAPDPTNTSPIPVT